MINTRKMDKIIDKKLMQKVSKVMKIKQLFIYIYIYIYTHYCIIWRKCRFLHERIYESI